MPTTYQRHTFDETLGQVRSMFAELRYIDRALAYLREQEVRWWDEAPGADSATFEVELGRTAPFTKRCRVPRDLLTPPWQGLLPWQVHPKEAEVREHLAGLAGEAETWAAAEIASFTERITPLTAPAADSYEYRLIRPLEAVHDALSYEVSTDVGGLRHSLSEWEGAAADNFATRFYHPFGDTLHSQTKLIEALAAGIATAKAIVESTQHSLMDVVDQVRNLLHEQLALRAEQAELTRQESARTALIVGGETLGIVGAIASGGLWSAGLAAFAGTANIASTTIPDPVAADHEVRGSTAEGLLIALSDATTLINQRDHDEHELLARAVERVLRLVTRLRDGNEGADGRLVPIRPDLVDGVDSGDFYLD